MSHISRRLLLPLVVMFLGSQAFAQIRFGVKAGVPISEYFETESSYSSATRRYTLGPSIEATVWRNISLEFDALYKRIGYNARTGSRGRFPPFYIDTYEVKGGSWDFPLMVKYRFPRVPLYVASGALFPHIGPVRARGERTGTRLVGVNGGALSESFTEPLKFSAPFDLRKRSWPGLTAGAGIEFGRGRFRVLPEFRYTRITSNITDRDGIGGLRLNQNQIDFLLGFLF
jgi:hypothetical protein